MQFPVPQFTDVEDRIIGPLTIKQFGIVFGAGILVFLAYSTTKSIPVTVFFFLLIGLPAIGIAFGKVNGRPVYASFGFLFKFFFSPKALVFHKEANNFTAASKVRDAAVAKIAAPVETTRQSTRERLLEVQRLLEQKAEEERKLAGEIR